MRSQFYPLVLGLSSLASAWIPSDAPDHVELSAFHDDTSLVTSRHFQSKDKRWIPSTKLRGVNLGSQFIIEPWMCMPEWDSMGCGGLNSEFDCVQKLGQTQADKVFQQHWSTWINATDLDTMGQYGLNTIRIPIGYWIFEDLKYSSESFPNGGLAYLDALVEAASNRGFYIILNLHGAPYAQVAKQPFTGQYAQTAQFYQSAQFERAYEYLERMATRVFAADTKNAYRNVGMLEVVNEPDAGHPNLISEFYPTAYSRIRAAEDKLNVSSGARLHVQFMNKNWNAGDPNANLPANRVSVSYDSHRYLKYDATVTNTQAGYISAACNYNVASDGDTPVVVGEWSISVNTSVEDTAPFTIANGQNKAFYTKFWNAQVQGYEKQLGWVFWGWKTQLGDDYRWSYTQAVQAGVIPKDPSKAASSGACS